MNLSDYRAGDILYFTQRGKPAFVVVLDETHWRWLNEENDSVLNTGHGLETYVKNPKVIGNIDDFIGNLKEKLNE